MWSWCAPRTGCRGLVGCGQRERAQPALPDLRPVPLPPPSPGVPPREDGRSMGSSKQPMPQSGSPGPSNSISKGGSWAPNGLGGPRCGVCTVVERGDRSVSASYAAGGGRGRRLRARAVAQARARGRARRKRSTSAARTRAGWRLTHRTRTRTRMRAPNGGPLNHVFQAYGLTIEHGARGARTPRAAQPQRRAPPSCRRRAPTATRRRRSAEALGQEVALRAAGVPREGGRCQHPAPPTHASLHPDCAPRTARPSRTPPPARAATGRRPRPP